MNTFFCLLLALMLAGTASAHEPIKLYMPDAPPLTLHDYESGHGMAGDVVLAALARIGKLTHIVAEPWPRAQINVSRGRNMLIIPLSRTPEREELYTWIASIMELERAFFSLDDPVENFAQARQRYRRIGVGMGTAQVGILQRQGFSDEQIVQLKLGENPAHLLSLGRIDAWFTGVPEALYIWESSAYREQNLRRSPTLASTGLYLGCSKDCDAQLVEQLRTAISELEQDGVSAEVIDLRSLVPLDRAHVIASVRKTGRLIVVDEDYHSFGVSGEIIASVVEHDLGMLKASPQRVAFPDIPIPFTPVMEQWALPNAEKIVAAYQQMHEEQNR